MSGREEAEALAKIKIEEILKDKPKYYRIFISDIKDYSYNTQWKYLHYIMEFIGYVENLNNDKYETIKDLNRISKYDILEYKEHLSSKISDSLQVAKISAIKRFFKTFAEQDLDKNPAINISLPKRKYESNKVVIENEAMEHILNNVRTAKSKSDRAQQYNANYIARDTALFALLATTGIRIEPLVQINVEDVDIDNKTVKVTSKGDKTSSKMYDDEVAHYLKEYLQERKNIDTDSQALFLSNRNQRMHVNTARHIIKRITDGLDQKITPHKFRGSYGSKIYEATGDINLVAELLDHSDVNTTRRAYVQVSEERQRSATTVSILR